MVFCTGVRHLGIAWGEQDEKDGCLINVTTNRSGLFNVMIALVFMMNVMYVMVMVSLMVHVIVMAIFMTNVVYVMVMVLLMVHVIVMVT